MSGASDLKESTAAFPTHICKLASFDDSRKKKQRKAREMSSEEPIKDQMEDCLQHLEDLKSGQDQIWHALISLLELQSNLRSHVEEGPSGDSPENTDNSGGNSVKTKLLQLKDEASKLRSDREHVKAKKKPPSLDGTVNPTVSGEKLSSPALSYDPKIIGTLHDQLAESKKTNEKAEEDKRNNALKMIGNKGTLEKLRIESLEDAMWAEWKQCDLLSLSLQTNSELSEESEAEAEDEDFLSRRSVNVPLEHVHVPLLPNSSVRITWDVLSLLVIGYDCVMLPFVTAFRVGESGGLDIVNIVVTVFWTFDVGMSLATAYTMKGKLETRAYMVLKRYLHTWFPIDIVVMTIDYLSILLDLDSTTMYGRLARAPKVIRIMRILRIIRLLRLGKVIQNWDLINVGELLGDWAALVFSCWSVLRLAFLICFANHFLACIWYSIGYANRGNPSSWVDKLNQAPMGDDNLVWNYFTAFHWCLTQFSPASVNIHPENLVERCFAIILILFGFVVFSSFVSAITAELTEYRRAEQGHLIQQEHLRKYATKHNLPRDMGEKLLTMLKKDWMDNKKIDRVIEMDITFFEQLSDEMRKEVRGYACVPILANVPLFYFFNMIDKRALFRVCYRAVFEGRLAGGKTLFYPGDVCKQMLILISGHARYYQINDHYHILPCDYVSEMCIWFRWDYQGRLVASREITYFQIDSEAFRTAIKRTCEPSTFASLKDYAKVYVESINLSWSHANASDIFCLTRSKARTVFAHQLVEKTGHGNVSKTWLGKVRSKQNIASTE